MLAGHEWHVGEQDAQCARPVIDGVRRGETDGAGLASPGVRIGDDPIAEMAPLCRAVMLGRPDHQLAGEGDGGGGFGGVQTEHPVAQQGGDLVRFPKSAGLAGSEQRQHDAGALAQLAAMLSR